MEVLGTSAEDLGSMKESDEQAFDNVFQQANFKEYTFKVRAKMDTFNVRRALNFEVYVHIPLQRTAMKNLLYSPCVYIGRAEVKVLLHSSHSGHLCPGDKTSHRGDTSNAGLRD